MSAATILVVEDNPITRKMLRITLEIEGYDVIECPDGKTALQRAAERRPDLLIFDLVLPDMDGLQLLGEVRALHLAELPAILVTGMVSRLEDLRARAGAATQVVAKPVEPSQLVDIVRAQLAPPERLSPGQRVLVVDDEPLNVKLATFRLKRGGYEVETAPGGAEALEIARIRRPDVILSDVMMPAMDGFTLCREIRREPTLATVPVVLVSSAYVDQADRDLARQMGASTLVVRTPDLRDAMAAIEAAVHGGSLPPPTTDDVSLLHRERLQVQLERQTARNESLLRQAAIQATALSIIKGLSEVMAEPRDVPQILGDVLVHCLDAAGLSTGLLYMTEAGGQFRLHAQFGIPAGRHDDAAIVFGHPEIVRRIVDSGQPAALSASTEGLDHETQDFLARLGHSSVLLLPFVVLAKSVGALVLASDSHDLSETSWLGFARNLALQFGQTVALGQSLKRLAASEARYRALMEHASDAIFVLSAGGTILEANGQSEMLLGRARDQVVGRHLSEFAPPAVMGVPDPVAAFQQTLAAGGSHVENVTLLRGDGTPVEVDFSMSLSEIDGKRAVISIGRDVTERRRAEADLRERMELAAFEADVASTLVANDPQPVALRRCADAMVRHLDAAFARIWTLDEAGETLELQASAGLYTHLDGAHARVRVGQLKIGLIAAERQAHLTNDVRHDPRVSDQAWAEREGMVSFAGYPLVVGDALVGVMALFARHPLSRTVLEAMASVANQIALGIERNRTEKALRDAQRRLEHVVSSSPAVLYSMAVDGQTLTQRWVSANVERLLGDTPEEVSSPGWWMDRLHADDRDRVLAQVPDLLAEGQVVREYRFRHKDGSYRWVRDEQILVRRLGEPAEVIGSWSDVTARKEAESRQRESEEQYRLLFDSSPFPMAVIDRDTRVFLAVNDASVRSYGYSRDEFMAMTVQDFRTPGEDALLYEDYGTAAGDWSAGDEHFPRTRKHKKKDGTVIEVEINRSALLFQGRPAWLTLIADVTQKRSLEAQLLKAQKMEAVGQLAGGVAHDFNNLLGVITGYSELLMRELPEGSRERKRGEEIKRAADRAAALTRQLLAFSRRQLLQPKVLDLNETVAEVEKMMRRLISESIQIVTVASAGLGKVRADEGQLEQVLMNLAINARDAMPSGGRLVIETANVELDETYRRTNPEATPGSYVMLGVSDTGHGMDANTMSRIFEPFFTTKEEGKGTGLGLATVYGIVRQSGGTVNVYSEPGRGTSFKVYLPRVEAAEEASARKDTSPPPGGTETILVVEDAEALRVLVRELLENAGYEVLEAEAPEKALDLVEATAGEIHLVLTDMVMPRMSGQELARRIEARRPRTRVVFMSGYSDQAVGDLGTLAPGTAFLQKPFTMDALMRTVRHALDSPAPPPEPSA